jgi:FKBP-type peptidyl-prolyl cis-trans isomerase FkpA
MKKNLIILAIITLGFVACEQYKNGDGGMLYKIHTDKSGPTIKKGDFVAFKFIQKTEGDSIMYNSYDFEQATPMYAEAPLFKGDFNSGMALLSEGDSATIKVSMDSIRALAKRKLAEQPTIKGKYIIYVVKIVKVIPSDTANLNAFQNKIRDFMSAEAEKAKNDEASRVSNYISSKNLKPVVTPSGLNYVITKQGSGPKPAVGDTVEFNYTVSLLSGTVFDTSLPALSKKASKYDALRQYIPLKMPVGMHNAIPGFDEGLMLFPAGTSATLIMPSKLAYGDQGGALPPYTPLAFDVEILKIIHPKPGSTTAEVPAAPSGGGKK